MVERAVVFPGEERTRVLIGLAHSRWSLVWLLLPPWGLIIKKYPPHSSSSPGGWSCKVPTSCKQLSVSGQGAAGELWGAMRATEATGGHRMLWRATGGHKGGQRVLQGTQGAVGGHRGHKDCLQEHSCCCSLRQRASRMTRDTQEKELGAEKMPGGKRRGPDEGSPEPAL